MKFYKRVLSALLTLCLALSALTGCSTSEAASSEPTPSEPIRLAENSVPSAAPAEEPTLDDELLRAQKAGFILDGWLEDMDMAVTFQEYSTVTTRLVELWDKSRLDEWKETVKLASKATYEMAREDGFLMLSYAWVPMGYNHENVFFFIDEDVNPDLDYWSGADEQSQMKELSWNYPYFSDALTDEIIYDIFKSH